MRDRTKVAIATAALVVAGVGARAAQAQNYFTAPAIPYFSIAIPVFYKVAYTGPTPPVAALAIDDLTYSMPHDPSAAAQCAAYFPRGVMGAYYTPAYGGTNPNASNQLPFPLYRFSNARRRPTGLFVTDFNANPAVWSGMVLDAFIVETHAEQYAVSTASAIPPAPTAPEGPKGVVPPDTRTPFGPSFGSGPGTGVYGPYNPWPAGWEPPSNPPPDEDPDVGSWKLMGVTETTYATETSQSRHYETPHFLPYPHQIHVLPAPAYAPGQNVGIVYVKGRVLYAGPPVIDGTIAVTQIP